MRAGSSTFRTLLVGLAVRASRASSSSRSSCVFSQRANLREMLLGRFADQYVVVMPTRMGGNGDPDVLAHGAPQGSRDQGVTGSAFPPWQFQGSRSRYSLSTGR